MKTIAQVKNKSEGDCLLRSEDVAKKLGVSITTLWRWHTSGYFPEPLKLGRGRISAWKITTVDEWIDKL